MTLFGEPSGGGSGAARRFLLPRTLVHVSLSSMASFRPNGLLYDGRGIDVDIRALPQFEDFTRGTDSVLERALAVVRQQVERRKTGR